MLDVDFISGSTSSPDSTSSYDAIVIRFKEDVDQQQKIIVIDGGFSEVGNDIVNFIKDRYRADKIDLMVSTHPDNDHLNGLLTIIQQMPVGELLIHQPRLYRNDLDAFTNLENLDSLLAYAIDAGTTISDAYTGLERFNRRLVILGPSEDYYCQLLEGQLDPIARAMFATKDSVSRVAASAKDLLNRALGQLPDETLDDGGITSPRNNSSAITLLKVAGRHHLFTGDAGIKH